LLHVLRGSEVGICKEMRF